MKYLFLLILSSVSFSAFSQTSDLSEAKKKAIAESKLILLEFSGSDWCIPCIRLEKEVFNQEAFHAFAAEHLVVMQADFPRLKKHQLPEAQKKKNEKLADQYNPDGAFPFIVLLDVNGKVLKSWEGAAFKDPESFIAEVQPYFHDR